MKESDPSIPQLRAFGPVLQVPRFWYALLSIAGPNGHFPVPVVPPPTSAAWPLNVGARSVMTVPIIVVMDALVSRIG